MALEVSAGNYPVYYAVTEDNRVARWRPFVHWIMAIPHLIIGAFLSFAGAFAVMISWFAIVFTGKMPEGLANFIIMGQRYNARANGFALWLTEQYPPFDFSSTAGDPGNYAIRLDITPALEGRNRLTVLLRYFTMIPIMFFFFIVFIGVYFVNLIAFFAILFTGRYPVGMRSFVCRALRLGQRATAYANLLTDQYPPFALE
ncbi:MAG: DUF4389 domain-containing protein [Actinomycetota bacterium]